METPITSRSAPVNGGRIAVWETCLPEFPAAGCLSSVPVPEQFVGECLEALAAEEFRAGADRLETVVADFVTAPKTVPRLASMNPATACRKSPDNMSPMEKFPCPTSGAPISCLRKGDARSTRTQQYP